MLQLNCSGESYASLLLLKKTAIFTDETDDTMNTKSHQFPILRLKTESGSEEVYYPLMYDGLPEEFKFMAEEELKETEEKKLNGLQMLRDHIKRKNLHSTPDYLLVAILRACKYDMKKSKSKLENMISMRKEIADMLIKIGVNKVEMLMDNFSVGLLPYRDQHGCPIIYTRPDGFDINRHSMDDVGVSTLVLALFIIQVPLTTVSGIKYFAECKHLSAYVYPAMKATRRFMFHPLSLPIRVSSVNVLNPIPIAYWFYKVASPLFPQKITKRVCFYPKGYDILQKDLNTNILPEEFGGNLGALSNSHFKEKFLEFAKALIAEYE